MSTLIPFVKSGYTQFVRSILEKDVVDVNEKDVNGFSALHHAVGQGHSDMIGLLLEYNIDINAKTLEGLTAVMIAVERGHQHVVWTLCTAGANLDLYYDIGDNLVNRAAWLGHVGIVAILLEHFVDPLTVCDEYNALHAASHEGWPAVVKLLVDNGVRVDCRADWLRTSLHISAGQEKTPVVSMLIDNGADIEARDLNGDTALHYGILTGNTDVVKVFLDAGSRTDVVNTDGFTAMHLAANVNDARVMLMLCNRGVNIEMRQLVSQQTPLIYAAVRGNGNVVQCLAEARASVNAQDITGNTALHYCVRSRNPWSIRALLRAGANMYIENNTGVSPLKEARATALPFGDIEWVGVEPAMDLVPSMSDTIILLENRHAKNVLAIAMGLHERLGQGSRVSSLDPDVLRIALRLM
jgi:uncharacterized protein